jgi:hypothetical protein
MPDYARTITHISDYHTHQRPQQVQAKLHNMNQTRFSGYQVTEAMQKHTSGKFNLELCTCAHKLIAFVSSLPTLGDEIFLKRVR